jgi:LPXTG-site transpeptidase (sortase) family protein
MRRILTTILVLAAFAVAAMGVSAATASRGITSTIIPATVHLAPPPTASATAVKQAKEPILSLPASQPVRIIIPAIGVNAPVVPVSKTAGSVGTPPLTNHDLAGWYDGSVTPGQTGPSLIDGHIDGDGLASVFYRVPALKTGDVIRVLLKDGETASFKVTWVQVVAKTAFPWKAVLGWTSYPSLRLVTCGGPFNSLTGHYVENVIVYATEQ